MIKITGNNFKCIGGRSLTVNDVATIDLQTTRIGGKKKRKGGGGGGEKVRSSKHFGHTNH